jgi:hypothetical protein
MAEIIGVYDGGIQKHQGHKVGVIVFKFVTNEGKPEEIVGYCNPNFRDSVIKNLKRLNFQKQKAEENDAGRETAP